MGRPIWISSSWTTWSSWSGSGVAFAASLLVQVFTKGSTFLWVKLTITIGVEVLTQLLHTRITGLSSVANAAKRGFSFRIVQFAVLVGIEPRPSFFADVGLAWWWLDQLLGPKLSNGFGLLGGEQG